MTLSAKLTLFGPLLVALAPGMQASTLTFNLQTDWSNSTNPNGAWKLLQGTNVLPFQSNFTGCFNGVPGLGGGWAPSPNGGNCLPAFFKTTGNAANGDWATGDILVHSYDTANSSGTGEAIVSWTAPVAGVISYNGTIWYAHTGLQRSNDFFLTLNGTTENSGTIAFDSIVGNSRANQDPFSGSGFAVNAGDVIALRVQRTAGQTFGSLDGINLAITEVTPVTLTPEPTTLFMLGGASLLFAFRRKR